MVTNIDAPVKVVKHKERNKRVEKEDVNILDYEALIWKIITKSAMTHGNWVYDHKESLKQVGYMALMSALKSYDPTKGTFITIAWLRVTTHIGRVVRKKAIEYASTNHLEDLNFTTGSNEAIAWQDLFPSNEIDLNVIGRLAINPDDNVDVYILSMLTKGVSRRSMPRQLSELLGYEMTHEEAKERVKTLRDNMVAVCNEIYDAE